MNTPKPHPDQKAARPATGADLYKLVTAMRRKGYTASFGVDKDPKLVKA